MSDVKVQQRQVLSRQEAARLIGALAEGLGNDGRVTVELGSGTLELSVGSQVDFELEVVVDGEEIELELELKWSAPGRRSVEAAQDQSEAGDLEQDDSGEYESDEEESDEEESDEDWAEEDDEYADGSGEALSDADVAAEEVAPDGASDEEAAGPTDTSSVSAAAPDESARPRRGRRKAGAATGKPAFNGVDTAAVRAWAAANGLAVSPRGRIKEEVIAAYRAAGN